jgi:hypothetical protein
MDKMYDFVKSIAFLIVLSVQVWTAHNFRSDNYDTYFLDNFLNESFSSGGNGERK